MKRRITLITAAVVAACAVLPSVASAATIPLKVTATPSTSTSGQVDVRVTAPAPWHVSQSWSAGGCWSSYAGSFDYVGGNLYHATWDPHDSSSMRLNPGDSIDVTCDLTHSVKHTKTVTTHTWVDHSGARTTGRSTGAYVYYGSCNWGGDGSGGLISTCLDGHASANYTFRVPRGHRFERITHTVKPGITACRNQRWSVRHKPGTRIWHVTFTHRSSANGWSQCDIRWVSLRYAGAKRVTTTSYPHAYGEGSAIVQ